MSAPSPPPTAPAPPTVWLGRAMDGHVGAAVAGVATPDGAGDGDPRCQQLALEPGPPEAYHENVAAAPVAGAARTSRATRMPAVARQPGRRATSCASAAVQAPEVPCGRVTHATSDRTRIVVDSPYRRAPCQGRRAPRC